MTYRYSVKQVARLTFVGELGYELHVEAAAAHEVYESLFRVARELGLPLFNAGYKATASLSLEKSYRHWHGDLRPTGTTTHTTATTTTTTTSMYV